MPKLQWSDLPGYKNALRKSFNNPDGNIAGFVKTYKTFSFYWVLNAGHMVSHMVIRGMSSAFSVVDRIVCAGCYEQYLHIDTAA